MTALFALSYAVGTYENPRTVYRVLGLDDWSLSSAPIEPISMSISIGATTPASVSAQHPFETDMLKCPGDAVAILGRWTLDHTVQLRQELMLGMCEFEQAGYYAKTALAVLGGDSHGTDFTRNGLVRIQGTPTWVLFAPVPEIEALRQAICRQLWTEMQNAASFNALLELVQLYAPVAELENEYVHCAAAYLAADAPEAAKTVLAAVQEEHHEFEPISARAEMLADVLRGRIRFAMKRAQS
jgi:hypothetical protein